MASSSPTERAAHGPLGALVAAAIGRPWLTVAVAAAALAWGLAVLATASYDVFPDFAPPEVEIQTEAPGLSPEQVELLVTRPIEAAVNGAPGIASLRSSSVQGISLVTARFASGAAIARVRQDVSERLANLGPELPDGVEPPVLSPLTSATGNLMTIGLTSSRATPMELRTAADWVVAPRLRAAPGVAKVSVYGGEVRRVEVQVDPEALVRHRLGLADVVAATRRATGIRGAGFLDTPNQRVVLDARVPAAAPAVLAATVVAHEPGGNVRVGDLARVVAAPAPAISDALVDGRPAVVMNVWAQHGANSLAATDAVDAALAELAPTLRAQGIAVDADLFRASRFVAVALRNIEVALLLGALLVVAVLFLFLSDLRAAAISCAAIPVSLLVAVALLQRLGLALDVMTLGGLAVAIGEVVDDAVIDVENIQRRLHENRLLATPRPAAAVVLAASLEVRSAVVWATLAVALVFVPVLTMGGLAGSLLAPLATAYILAVAASLVVALTVTPALALLLLAGEREEHPERAWLQRARERYRARLGALERHAPAAIATVVFGTVVGVAVLPFLGRTFLPELHESHYIVHMELVPGSSIGESVRVGRQVRTALAGLPFVRSVAQRVGRAAADEVLGPQASEIEVDLADGAPADAVERMRGALATIPGPAFAINSLLTERVEETISGYTAPLVVQLFGSDLEALDRAAAEVAARLGRLRGARDVRLASPPGLPELEVRLRPEALARHGLAPLDVLDAVHAATSGAPAGQLFDGDRVVDVVAIASPAGRQSPAALLRLPVRAPDGRFVPLAEVAAVEPATARAEIRHEATRRVQTVTADVAGRDVASLAAETTRLRATGITLPPGTTFHVGGAAEEEARSRRALLLHSLLVLVAIAVLLAIVLRRGRNVALVALDLPFALVGGALAALATGEPLSIGSLVGFVTLFGITLRNSIMMLAHFEHLVAVEGEPWGLATAIRGAGERLAPILMTSLVTALGLLPLALGRNAAGREIEGAMATVILGGLATSTLLNLFVLPMLSVRFGRFGPAAAAERAP